MTSIGRITFCLCRSIRCANRNQAIVPNPEVEPTLQSTVSKTILDQKMPAELMRDYIFPYVGFNEMGMKSISETNASLNKEYWHNCLSTRCCELNLTTVHDKNQLIIFLEKIKDIKKLKIRGLHNPAKLKLFINAINSLDATVRFDNLSHLNLSRNGLSSNNFLELHDVFLSRTKLLMYLNLTDNDIEADGAIGIANSTYLQHLTSLDISVNNIEDAGIKAIAESVYMTNLTSLIICWSRVGDIGAIAIANSVHMKKLIFLDLASNDIGDDGVRAILESTHLNKLILLDLFNNSISENVRQLIRARFSNI